MRQVGAVAGHGLRHLDAVLAPELVIVLAVARRDVHEAGAVLLADEVAGEQRDRETHSPGRAADGGRSCRRAPSP